MNMEQLKQIGDILSNMGDEFVSEMTAVSAMKEIRRILNVGTIGMLSQDEINEIIDRVKILSEMDKVRDYESNC